MDELALSRPQTPQIQLHEKRSALCSRRGMVIITALGISMGRLISHSRPLRTEAVADMRAIRVDSLKRVQPD